MIYNPTTSSNGALTIYHPTSVSTNGNQNQAVLSGITSMPTGIMYIGDADSFNCPIAFYIIDGDGNEIVNDYSVFYFDDTVTVSYQSTTSTLTIEGTANYYVFSTNIEEYYIF